jgi:pyridoxamine--pyruvate transaminase
MLSLDAACARVLDEGLDQVIARHDRAARGCRAGARALGLDLWPRTDDVAANAVTVVAVPDGLDAGSISRAARAHGLMLVPGRGALAGRILRIDHMGAGAFTEVVFAALVALAAALRANGLHADLGEAIAAAAETLG